MPATLQNFTLPFTKGTSSHGPRTIQPFVFPAGTGVGCPSIIPVRTQLLPLLTEPRNYLTALEKFTGIVRIISAEKRFLGISQPEKPR